MLRPSLEHQFIYIAVEGVIWKTRKITDAVKVIVLSFGPAPQSLEVISRVPESQNSCTTGLNPISGIFLAMTLD